MNRRGRLAIAIAVGGGELGHRVARVNYRLGYWTFKAGQKVAHLLMLPERLAERRRQRQDGGGHG